VRDRLQPESRKMELVSGVHRDDVWTPAFALRGVVPYGTESGVTAFGTFYEAVIFGAPSFCRAWKAHGLFL
jgi:hypothetical protein